MAKYLVTGGSGDIGRAIIVTLLAEGHSVICQYYSSDLDELKAFFNSHRVEYWQADLSQPFDRPNLFDGLDGMIYAAGCESFGLIQDFSAQQIDAQYYIHLKSLILLNQWMMPGLLQKQYGRIIVISSIWGETGASMESLYATMKAGQLGLIKSLAKELALSSITVNAVTPGLVRGRMTDALDAEAILEEIPQGELVEPEEVAFLVNYLLDKKAQHMTGQVLRLNSGWLI
ncbi:SDR family oxidoreductase [Macrococcus hajekii]|uniref:SDR family oxidoreductase n=1 Tax=Macrococcus hajekii TaxID=198482 RepID=A0A4R6BMZ0_9STAP|nr:SDR family oxidoreductase [Macrococcus hajekii]TDM03141.1 SDR family oxidoreductase [Macrococcus hajekii]GGA96297.1 3-oxoacyl-ACP reductase [Macrococcus hajekii]